MFMNDPAHWRQRAEEMRSLADEMKDGTIRDTVLRIANDYERLAHRATERRAGSLQSK
jgi:hypothetical protein